MISQVKSTGIGCLSPWLRNGLILTMLFLLVQNSLLGYVTISGPTVVLGGGSATYYYQESCDNWDACYGYMYDWVVVGGTITQESSSHCVVEWDLSAGTHRITGYFVYNYMMSGNWYADYNSTYINVSTTYQYTKTSVSSYSIDSTTISGLNYIQTFAPQTENTELPDCSESRSPNTNESFQFIDGLGRVSQTVNLKAAHNGYNISQYYEYDDFGRENVKYMSYPNAHAANGAFYSSNLKTLTLNQFGTEDDSPYAESVYDESPLNRILEQGSIGDDWQPADYTGSSNGNTRKFEYLANASTDNIRIWEVSSDTVCTSNSCYDEGDLYVTKTFDEDGNESLEYKDHKDQVILKELVLSTTVSLLTYYVYDDYGLLKFVLPPKYVDDHVPSGSTSTTFYPSRSNVKKYCYFYNYDDRKRVIEKQLPGADPIHMIYDKRDRLVGSQDGVARENNNWLITKYDGLDRPVLSGVYSSSSIRATLQSTLDNYTGDSLYESRTVATGNMHGYSNNAFPTGLISSDYLTVTYYDSYDDFPTNYTGSSYTTSSISGFTNISSSDFESTRSLSHLAGLVTGSKIKKLDSGSWYFSVNYYDEKGRLIQTKAQNHISGYERLSNAYDFAGSITKTVHEHRTSYDTIVAGERYVYDHRGRLQENYHQVSGETEILLAAMKYTTRDELDHKWLYSIETTSTKGLLQKLDYTYNIRGWLTALNDPDDLGCDWFAMELYYNDDTGVATYMTPTERFNGNICAAQWKNQNNSTVNSKKGYCYYYDDANRITSADYGLISSSTPSDFDVSNVSYDENGNILSLTRRDDTQILDSLDYDYSGNQLLSVNDDGDLTDGFTYSGSPSDYQYDKNGNLIYDDYKGIDTIDYNYMNLPNRVAYSGTDEIEFIYDAAGNKLQKKVTASSVTTTTNYVGNVVYEGEELKYIITSEGRLIPSENDYLYEYHIKDHLGNTRAAFDVDSDGAMNLRQLTDYYPFGMTASLYESSIDNNYLYNGKELQEELGLDWYDYGARFYDPVLGRWHVMDPMMESHFEYTPYHYTFNNPILYIDPLGLDTTVYFLDQAQNPDNKRVYTADVYVDVDGEINGPYRGSSFPNSDTRHNTLDEGEHDFNNATGHDGGTKKGLNIVDENGDRLADGTAPDNSDHTMENVNVHSGVSPEDDPAGLNRHNRGSAGCPTIHPGDSQSFMSNFDWSGSNGTTGNSRGIVDVQRGAGAEVTKRHLEFRKTMQNLIPKRPESTIRIPYRN